jgi:hypothetical protein
MQRSHSVHFLLDNLKLAATSLVGLRAPESQQPRFPVSSIRQLLGRDM